MPRYKISAYRSSSGRSDVKDWYEKLRDEEHAYVTDRIQYLRASGWPWPPRYYKNMKGDAKGLGEIRLKLSNTEVRLFGFFRECSYEFVVVIKCTEKSKKYHPPNSKNTAQKRKLDIIHGNAYAEEWFHD